ncbi:MAG: FtsX-like permease family protein [Bdellovibrionota bacterium]
MAKKYAKAYIAWMAWRSLISRKRKSGLSFMTTMSICGVALGVFALVVVLSVMGGFEQDLKSNMFRGLPHLEILANNAMAGFSLKEYPIEMFKRDFSDAVAIEPFTQADVVLRQKKHLASVKIFGVDPKAGGKLWGFSSSMVQGKLEDLDEKRPMLYSDTPKNHYPSIVLGESLAIELGVDIGEAVHVLNPQVSIRQTFSASNTSLSSTFIVSGIFRTDLPAYDAKYAVVSLEQGRKFMADYDEVLDEQEYVAGVALNISDPNKIDTFVQRVSKYKSLQALSWKKVNKSLLFALKLEKFTMGAILLLIVLVAAFSISGTMMMTVFHRRSQIALMRSLGMTQRDVLKLFITHGFSIGSVGIILGLSLGLLVCGGIYAQLLDVTLSEGVYYQKKLPVRFLPVDYLVIVGCAWVLSVIAAAYPAYTASKQDPGVGLRYR